MNNHTMMTDEYELTMSESYFLDGKKDEVVYFDAFFRSIPFESGYAIMAGGREIVDYIQNLKFTSDDIEYLRSLNTFDEKFLNYLKDFHFTGTIKMIPDGTPVFANEPIVTVKAPTIEAQIIETCLLSYLNANIKFATAGRRMVDAAQGIPIMEFGARRADGPEAATMASKAAYIAGCVGTSNMLAGKKYNIPVMGTMAHSMVTEAESEYEAFLRYAKTFPNNTLLLVDTYDTLKSGVPNAIRVAKEYLIPNGYRLKGIRIDSGDLAYLSKEARKQLDEAGLTDAKICLSNGLNPKTIASLLAQGAKIDTIGAGDNIAAPKERVGCVYKLVAKEMESTIDPRIKVSDDAIKTINPGYKKVYRFYDKETGYALGDVIAVHDEQIPLDGYTLIDPQNEFNRKYLENYTVRELQEEVIKDGKLVKPLPTVQEEQKYCTSQMETLYPEVRRLENPHKYYVDLSEKLLQLKKELIGEHKAKVTEGPVLCKKK